MRDRDGNPMVRVGEAWVGGRDVFDGERWRPTESVGEIATARLIREQLKERAVGEHLDSEMEGRW